MYQVVVFGTGNAWRCYEEYLKNSEVIAFLDNYPKKEFMEYRGQKIPVLKPEDFHGQYDYIVIASSYFAEIMQQLRKMGVCEDKMVPLMNYGYVKHNKQYCAEVLSDRFYERYIDSYQRYSNAMCLLGKNAGFQFTNLQRITSLHDVEFKVFSQWGEDGIIQWLIRNIPIQHKTFIEFGVENYREANTRFLMMNNNWQGMVIDGSASNIEFIKNDPVYAMYDLKALCAFITRENINELLLQSGFDEDLGILSVDIDGNDYWVLEAVKVMKPRIIICEYNAVFGGTESVTVPYKPDFCRTREHYSNLYFGASLAAVKYLCARKGYIFVGTNSNCCNAFFVRSDLASGLGVDLLDTGYAKSRFRESRDEKGGLTYLSGEERIRLIADMDVVDVKSMEKKKVGDLKID